MDSCPQSCVSQPGVGSEMLCNDGSKKVCSVQGRSSDWLVESNWESASSTFWFQLVWGQYECGQQTVNFSYLAGMGRGGRSVPAKLLKDTVVCPP